jgi:hypothetical protein
MNNQPGSICSSGLVVRFTAWAYRRYRTWRIKPGEGEGIVSHARVEVTDNARHSSKTAGDLADAPWMRRDRRQYVMTAAGPVRRSRRKSGRLPQDAMACNLGIVLDISAGGMSVLCTRRPRKRCQVHLHGFKLPARLMAVRTWCKRLGLFKQKVGLRFENVTPEMARRLTAIAATNRARRVLPNVAA